MTRTSNSFDLLELPRPPASAPWAYVKVAEGCDRRCGFCAIPSFRGKQRSRSLASILAEIERLEAREIVLVAQDLASYGHDRSADPRSRASKTPGIVELIEAAAQLVERVRLLYLYPSSLNDQLVEAVLATGVAYFDLSLQHASGSLLRKMRRYGNSARFLERIGHIRDLEPGAAFRSSFILGYPGETEEDHDELLRFLEEADLDWAGFFTFSPEEGTLAAGLGEQVPCPLALERLAECSELQEAITARRRRELVGTTCEVLVDRPGRARSYREAPEIDGVVHVPDADSRGVARSGPRGRGDRARPRGGTRCRLRARPGDRAMKLRESTFGPSALVTPANVLTLARLLASPIMITLVIAIGPSSWLLVGLVVRLLVLRRPRRRPRATSGGHTLGSVPRSARRQVPRPRRARGAGGNR